MSVRTTEWFASIPPLGTPESDEWRRGRLGASELGAAIGAEDAWQSRFELWERKTGRRQPSTPSETQARAMRIGQRLERSTLEDWCSDNCAEIVEYQRPGIVSHEPQVLATVESVCQLPTGERVVVEIKTVSGRTSKVGAEDTDEVPLHWAAQVQAEIWACDESIERALIVVLNRTSCEVRQFEVRRNWSAMCAILGRAREFWRCVSEDLTPPLDWSRPDESLRRHLYLPDPGPTVDWSAGCEAAKLWWDAEFTRQQIRELKKELERLESEVTVALGDNRRAILPGGRELVVQTISRRGYTVQPGSYTQLRARKER